MSTNPEEFINDIINNALETANDFTAKVDDAAHDLTHAYTGVYKPQPSTDQNFSVTAEEPEIPSA